MVGREQQVNGRDLESVKPSISGFVAIRYYDFSDLSSPIWSFPPWNQVHSIFKSALHLTRTLQFG